LGGGEDGGKVPGLFDGDFTAEREGSRVGHGKLLDPIRLKMPVGGEKFRRSAFSGYYNPSSAKDILYWILKRM
jgi:hypothetical protein